MAPKTGSQPLSRRGFLKLGGMALGSLILPEEIFSPENDMKPGRVLLDSIRVFDRPSFYARPIAKYFKDAILPITEQVTGMKNDLHNQEWCRIGNTGYTHSSWLQPVQIHFQEPAEELVFTGSLAEVTVPFADVYDKPSKDSTWLYRYYYSSTHWIDQIKEDSSGKIWYRVMDDKYPERDRWVRANRLRVIPYEELTPISPEVPADEKRIEVNIAEQQMTAFESGVAVYEAKVSTGDYLTNEQYQTPTGLYLIGLKRASQHMLPLNRTFGNYDLPGVPWVSYFTQGAHAFHGAFWHNSFGLIRSHGCVNLTPEDSRWVYLWSTPEMRPYNQLQYSETGGTRVIVY